MWFSMLERAFRNQEAILNVVNRNGAVPQISQFSDVGEDWSALRQAGIFFTSFNVEGCSINSVIACFSDHIIFFRWYDDAPGSQDANKLQGSTQN